MGAFDFVPEILDRCGVQFGFRKIATKPGKPTIFGATHDDRYLFALPGNPISAFVGFWMLVRPALGAMQGRGWRSPPLVQAILNGQCNATQDRQSYWPAKLASDDNGRLQAKALSWHGSGDPFGMAEANAMIVRPPQSSAAQTGDMVAAVTFDLPL